MLSAVVRPAADLNRCHGIDAAARAQFTEPVAVKVDNGAAERQPIQTCTNVGCFVAMTLTDKMIAAMRTGSELKITVQDANKKPIDMGLPLLGFGPPSTRPSERRGIRCVSPIRLLRLPSFSRLALRRRERRTVGKLTVSVIGVRSDSGTVRCGLYSLRPGFASPTRNARRGGAIKNGLAACVFNAPAGLWSRCSTPSTTRRR